MNAKKYSYDGDDWGSSEEEEDEDEEEPAPAVPSLPRNHLTQTNNPAPSAGVQSKTEPEKPLPFIRPADIYRKMVEEREIQRKQQTEQPSAMPGDLEPQVPHQHDTPHAHPVPAAEEAGGKPQTVQPPEIQTASSYAGHDKQAESAAEAKLQHNPSLGFRSAVHQAFDATGVPETPDSLNRNGSDSTISPIIRSGLMSHAQDSHIDMHTTPTIEEEPTEQRDSIPVNFQPGYRRSMTPPSPENNPAQRPVMADNLHRVKSDIALVGEPTPAAEKPDPLSSPDETESPKDGPTGSAMPDGQLNSQSGLPVSAAVIDSAHVSQPVADQSPMTADLIQGAPEVPLKDEPQPQEHPTLIEPEEHPTLQVDTQTAIPSVHVEQHSPGSATYMNSVNDRLRDEIMRSLTPSSAAGSEPRADQQSAQQHHSPPNEPNPDSHEDRPQLKKRFSWEQDSDDETKESQSSTPQPITHPKEAESAPVKQIASSILTASPVATPTSPHAPLDLGEKAPQDTTIDTGAPPRYSMLGMPTSSSNTPATVPPEGPSSTTQPQELESPLGPIKSASASESRPTTAEMRFMGFREIMAIKGQDQKMEAYESTREKFSDIDTGLADWIQYMANSTPDHAEIVSLNGRLPADADLTKLPPRSKFPKLASIGSISLPSSNRETTSSSGHTRQGSVNLGNLMHGKDLLHSAGVLGGKAGGAAKGFFARGRSKFRQNSTSDKVDH